MIFSAEYLAHGRNGAPEEAATVAELQIDVGSRCVTQNVSAVGAKRRPFIVIPTYVLAEGLVLRWWQIVAGRGRSQSLRRMRAGFAVPDVTFRSDGLDVHVETFPFAYDNPPVTFEKEAWESIPVPRFAGQLENFIQSVLQRLDEEEVRDTELQRRWKLVEASRDDPEERVFCEAAAALGVDPYRCDDASAALIEAAGALFDGEALYELLAGSEQDALPSSLAWVRDAEQADLNSCGLPRLFEHRGAGRTMLSARRPWDVGYAAARKLRADIGLGDRRPIPSTDQMGALFGNADFRPLATRDEAVRATVLENVPIPAVQLGRHARPSSELFAMARAIGDVYCYGDARRFPVMDNELTRRQKIGRAFAAEFVAPGEEVIRMWNTGRRTEQIAEHFGASPQLIDHQIENAPRWLAP